MSNSEHHSIVIKRSFVDIIAANSMALGEEADFEAQDFPPSTKVNTR